MSAYDRHFISACYYFSNKDNTPQWRWQKKYLPLVGTDVHTAILSTTSRTVLKQSFTNPSKTKLIEECVYTFPLYDGVSVVAFTCKIGNKVIRGIVKEKKKAKEIFDEAVGKGETAGLLVQAPEASDVFSTKLGNIPAGETIIAEIVYIGELKHHETEGIRFTIPTKIAPRYGSGPSEPTSNQAQADGAIRITVDINMPDGSIIKGVQSPSHPISVSLGTVSTASAAVPTMSKASATLALGSAALVKDFVLIVQSKDSGVPKALLETYPTISHHRALMVTLVPKFSLPLSRPEIVFIADRSGSMNAQIPMLISAMKVFLKSMPAGVKFNICSFGSTHNFLWPKSQTYTAETLQQAIREVEGFTANMGGTETFAAIKASIERRLADLPLDLILITDGDIWSQSELIKYVDQQVEETKGQIRIFPLGIGNGVSHALIEGIARAGNGFTQTVQNGERLDNCVVRMLRGALTPHITDYTLEVKYDKEDDFECIEKVTEGIQDLLSEDDKKPKTSPEKPIISLFDPNFSDQKEIKGLKESKFFLPEISTPKLLQAPHKIPSLFSFSRTTVYLLMSPDTIQRNPIAVTLRATSEYGPLELEIPVEVLTKPGKTIHQLAAKKAVQDLEEGRGWIYYAKNQEGVLIKEHYASYFDDLVEKEAVRLGEKFQVVGKWCSFIAVAAKQKDALSRTDDSSPTVAFGMDDEGGKVKEAEGGSNLVDFDFDAFDPEQDFDIVDHSDEELSSCALGSSYIPNRPQSTSTVLFGNSAERSQLQYRPSERTPGTKKKTRGLSRCAAPSPSGGLFGTGPLATAERSAFATVGVTTQAFQAQGSYNSAVANVAAGGSLFGSCQPQRMGQAGAFYNNSVSNIAAGGSLFGELAPPPKVPDTVAEKVHLLISLQTFDGYWTATGGNEVISKIIGVEGIHKVNLGLEEKVWTTLLVLKWLECIAGEEEGVWSLVGEKGVAWAKQAIGDQKLAIKREMEAEAVVKGLAPEESAFTILPGQV